MSKRIMPYVMDASGPLCRVPEGRRIIRPRFLNIPAEPANAYTSSCNVLLGFAAKKAAGCRYLQASAC